MTGVQTCALPIFTIPAFAASDSSSSDYEYPIKNCKGCGVAMEVDLEVSYPPDCVRKGFARYVRCTCGVLNTSIQIPALGHTPGRTSYLDPTCEWSGIISTYCARCDVCIDSAEEGDPLGHDWEPDPNYSIQAPTCTSPGQVDMLCTRCGYTKVEEIPALGGEHVLEETKSLSQNKG